VSEYSGAAVPGLRSRGGGVRGGVADGGAPATSEGAVIGAAARANTKVHVRVPASSANLGPGFDSLGLALRLYDVVSLTVTDSGLDVIVEGEGTGAVPLTEAHLVVRAVRAAFDVAGVAQPGLRLVCRNDIPHGKGLGSSAAAVVAGVVAARACLADPACLGDDAVLALATEFEGHPDNAAAALLGGATVAWMAAGGAPRAARVELHEELDAVLCVPDTALPTAHARTLLPPRVSHADAAFNAGRAALLAVALSRRPDLLLPATEDRLHQSQRGPAMPGTEALLAGVRARGAAAIVSGAGPSVLVLGTGEGPAEAVAAALTHGPGGARSSGWRVIRPGVDTVGAFVTTEGDSRSR
jgi:homoserine kinase